MDKIPVVDLSSILFTADVNEQNWIQSGQQFVKALHDFGFVYLSNHGVDLDKLEACFNNSKTFFEQPLKRKLFYKCETSPKGYHGQGYSIKDGTDIFQVRESFDLIGKIKALTEEDKTFHGSLLDLQLECDHLVGALLRLLSVGLDLGDVQYFIDRFQWINNPDIPSFKTFRTLYYPEIPERIVIPDDVLRVKEHSDFDFFTLLFQDCNGGLEIKTSNGKWIPATPLPGTLIVNIGDLLENWTGGYLPATKHRVIIPEQGIQKRNSRQSIAYFLHPDSNILVTPLKSPVIGKYYFPNFKAFEHTKAKLASVKSY